MASLYFSRAARAGTDDILVRTPELRPLRTRVIAQFGLGCLGAASALEFARAGVSELRMLDHDYVDPATMGRWPFGLSVAGLQKVDVIAAFISKDYPLTRAVPVAHCLGAVRDDEGKAPSDLGVIARMIEHASLIYDATAEIGVQCLLSELARSLGIPYVWVVGTYGGWGGMVGSITPDRTEGCWMCYRYACQDGSIAEPPSDPGGEVQPLGCGDVTFTGAGFDMAQVALMGVRTAVSALCRDAADGYPESPWDALGIAFRDDVGRLIVPEIRGYSIGRHSLCPRCNGQ